jgi:hypothetical protein
MSPRAVQHFLVIYDIPAGQAEVSPFGNDYRAALAAHEDAGQQHRDDPDAMAGGRSTNPGTSEIQALIDALVGWS